MYRSFSPKERAFTGAPGSHRVSTSSALPRCRLSISKMPGRSYPRPTLDAAGPGQPQMAPAPCLDSPMPLQPGRTPAELRELQELTGDQEHLELAVRAPAAATARSLEWAATKGN